MTVRNTRLARSSVDCRVHGESRQQTFNGRCHLGPKLVLLQVESVCYCRSQYIRSVKNRLMGSSMLRDEWLQSGVNREAALASLQSAIPVNAQRLQTILPRRERRRYKRLYYNCRWLQRSFSPSEALSWSMSTRRDSFAKLICCY